MSNFVENSIGVFPNLFTLGLCDPHCQQGKLALNCLNVSREPAVVS